MEICWHGDQGYFTGPDVVRTEQGCWEWQNALNGGYGAVRMNGRTRLAHRVMYESVFGPLQRNRHLHHKCENPLCINPAHLDVLSQADHNRLTNSKLSSEQVAFIRACDLTLVQIAARFGISTGTAFNVRSGKSYGPRTDGRVYVGGTPSRFSATEVRAIRLDSRSHAAMAAEYRVAEPTIGAIRSGRRGGPLEPDEQAAAAVRERRPHPKRKLSEAAVKAIRTGGSLSGHARRLGVSVGVVHSVRHRKTYRDID